MEIQIRMRLLFPVFGACTLLFQLCRGADVTQLITEQIEAATIDYQGKKADVREVLVAATHSATKPQALAEAMAALEMFDAHNCISAESSDKARTLYKTARDAYMRQLLLIRRKAITPDDKTRVSEIIAAFQSEQRFDLSGKWEMRSSGLPKGVRRLYEFSDQANQFEFTVTGDPDIRESAGTVQWNNDWTALAGESVTVFQDDRSLKRRAGKLVFQVIDANTLRGTHTRFYWDSKGNEIKRESYSSTLKRVGAESTTPSPESAR